MTILKHLSLPACGAAALLCFAAGDRPVIAQTFSEPATIFYGKVIGTGSPQPFSITEGALQWVIQRADGTEVTLATSLFAFEDGELSYRLEVPHAALGLGLTAPSGGVPLPPIPQTHIHKLVTVDGETASLLGPASSAFTSEQLLRTATYRMDLALGRAAVDTDGDGLADWWEDKHGLDKQNPSDANVDANGDGLTALQAYLQGLDPNHDYRKPELLTRELIVYPAGRTAVLLDAKDLNSTPSNLLYTLASLPNAGALTLRNAVANPSAPDLLLAVGAQFSQADVLRGRVVYTHDGSAAQPGSFAVVLRDENPASGTYTGVVDLLAYEPAALMPAELPLAEAQRIENHLFAAAGHVVMDGSHLSTNASFSAPSAGLDVAGALAHLTAYGVERSHVLADGKGNDTLRGGMADDVLFAGAGTDLLGGGAGADRFVLKSFASGRKTIEDFRVADLDVLDLSRIPAAPESFVHQYLRLALSAGVYRVQTDLDGNGAGFTNVAVELPGLAATDADLYTLIESGRVLVGGLRLEPRITVAATSAQASENGPTPGVFTVTRQGSLDQDVVVNIAMAGAAQNGVDYSTVLPTVTIPAGQASATVTVTPFADSNAEPSETVELVVQPGSGYRIGSTDRATLTIEDLLMLVELEVLEPVAVKDTQSAATFLLTRRDVINRDVIVRLTIGGTAANGTDYNTISTFIQLPAFTTTALINVTPKAAATLAGGMETVVLSIRPDAAYRVSGAATAQVAIIERVDTLDAWRTREVPGAQGGTADFAQTTPGDSTVSYLERYAFGLGVNASDLSGLPRAFLHDGRLAVTFRKPLGVSDVQYRVTAATSVSDWNGTQVPVIQIPAPSGSTDPQQLYYIVDPSAAAAGTIFTAVDVEWTP